MNNFATTSLKKVFPSRFLQALAIKITLIGINIRCNIIPNTYYDHAISDVEILSLQLWQVGMFVLFNKILEVL